MRVIVFFDLPTLTSLDQRNYRNFKKALIKEGFVMIQYSVYSKLALNSTAATTICNKVAAVTPRNGGSVEILCITEKQFSSMRIICDNKKSDIIQNDKKVLIL